MPYKTLSDRRRRYRERRLSDPRWVARYRAYQREYQKKWLKAHPEKREHHRELVKTWRKEHPRKFRATQQAWRKRNPKKVRQMRQRWYALHGKLWYQKNRIKRREHARKTYKKERRRKLQQQLARRRRHYVKNRDRIRTAVKQKRMANPERFRAVDRARYWRNPEKRRHQSRVARAKRTGSSCYLSLEGWKSLLRHFRFRCFYCSVKLTKRNRSLDHKIPLVRGGTNDIANLVPSCLRCNQRKNAQTADEFQGVF
jgi:hypothetical protein